MEKTAENGVIKDVILSILFVSIIVGLVGNILSFVIFFYAPSIRKLSISIYFRAIACIDSIMLVDAISFLVSRKFGIGLIQLNTFLCKFKIYFSYATGAIPPWLMVFISIDRFIKISFPKRLTRFFTLSFQILVIVTTIVYNYFVYSFIIWNSHFIRSK